MTVRAEEAEAALIQSVCSALPERVAPERASQCDAFVRQFYHWVPMEDLAGRSPAHLLEAAMSIWEFASVRAPGAASVRAYSPDPETQGPRSANTVVEVVTDDMPFLVDSVGMELSRQGYGTRLAIVPVIEVLRDPEGRLVDVLGRGDGVGGSSTETMMRFETDPELDGDRLEALVLGVRRVLGDVRAAIEDGPIMRQRAQELAVGVDSTSLPLDRSDVREVAAFLDWVAGGNFIFLGYRQYDLETDGDADRIRAVQGSGLGILRDRGAEAPSRLRELPADVRALVRAPVLLILTKANSRATVHRPLYLDYIGVKRFEQGVVCGEHRFLGLYTAAAEEMSPRTVPILRGKVERVMRRAGFPPDGHQMRELTKTLHDYPRSELWQVTDDELFEISMGIVALGERQRVRLFVRADPYKRFVSCLVFVPRDRYNTENRERIGSLLREAYGAEEIEWAVRLSDSSLARIHYVLRGGAHVAEQDADALERLIATATRPWTGHLADALREVHGEEHARELLDRYRLAFPIAYRADWRARAAVPDIDRAESLAAGERLVINVYQRDDGDKDMLRCKLLSPGERIALSDVLPIFENMGLRVGDERPYEITPAGRESIWLYDLGLLSAFDVDLRTKATRSAFQEAFTGVWTGELENDRLGVLVLMAGLTGREVSLLRALLRYLRQAGSKFSEGYLQQALTTNPGVARLLVELFGARFDPQHHDAVRADRVGGEIERMVESIRSLDRAQICRDCQAVINATVRTNYFQRTSEGTPKPQLTLKLDSSLISPGGTLRPHAETFVYSPRVEGVYLRHARIARGAIRWSDRREDFRAETLALMEHETVRNAAIVPAGAKGGFVVKRVPSTGGREALLAEAADCYRLFVGGLLDVIDDVVGGEVIHPPETICHDGEDVYLVAGAEEHGDSSSELLVRRPAGAHFWLAEPFAGSGLDVRDRPGRTIGALGAWESVARHLRDLGIAVQSDPFTVVGVGSASDEAFATAMQLSPGVRLVGAFDDRHVFLDPDPDPARSDAERRRLLELPDASWDDYDPAAISQGGAVVDRSAERVRLSPQVRKLLAVDADEVTPDELIRALLRAPVDLLYTTGTGTLVKSQTQSNAELADKTRDAIRVNGAELRCQAVGEACSGAFTQLGRIEYARAGGLINADTIDAAAELAYSDHEVNLELLLDAAAATGELAPPAGEELLVQSADALSAHVVGQSHAQALGLSLERSESARLIDLHARLITALEARGVLDRERASLPREARLRELKAADEGLTGPELALLSGHARIAIAADLLASDLPEDGHFGSELLDALPAAVRDGLRPHLRRHLLRRELISTDLANSIVDRVGTTFVSRLAEETGADTAHIARAYAVAEEVFGMRSFWGDVRALDGFIAQRAQFTILLAGRRLVTRAARWLVRNRRPPLDIAGAISDYASAAASLWETLPGVLRGLDAAAWDARVRALTSAGVPSAIAARVAAMDAAFFAFDIVESARGTAHPVRVARDVHFALDRRLELGWLRDRVLALPRADVWQALARANLRDDLYRTHRSLTTGVLATASEAADTDVAIDRWSRGADEAIERYLGMLRDIRAAPGHEFTTLLVAVRQLAALTARDRAH
jgi:glutamate dehydrogenase